MSTILQDGINSGNIVCIPKEHIGVVSPRIRELLNANTFEWDYFTTPDALLESFLAPNVDVWIAPCAPIFEAFMCTAIVEYASGNKDLTIVIATGVHIVKHIDLFHAAAFHIAQLHRCSRITMSGRPAFKRLLASHGFKPDSYPVLTCEVPNVLWQTEGRTDQ